jgi:unspecific monooxygenase
MLSAIDDTVADLQGKTDGPQDLREIMQRMTLEIAGRTMFSYGMAKHGKVLRDFVMEYGQTLARPHFFDLLLPQGWPTPQDIPRYFFRRRWTRFVAMLVAERRAAGKADDAPPRDLFELMVAARDPETDAAFSNDSSAIRSRP